MTQKEKEVLIGFFADESFRRKFKAMVAEKGKTIREVAISLIEGWMNSHSK